MDNKIVSKILGESDSDNGALFIITRKLAGILNDFRDGDIEDTSPHPGAGNEIPSETIEDDTSEESEEIEQSADLIHIRTLLGEWAEEAHGLLPGNEEANKYVDSILDSVHNYMHHEHRDCLYNLSEPWAEFLRKNPKGPQLVNSSKGYRAISNSIVTDVLSGDPLGES